MELHEYFEQAVKESGLSLRELSVKFEEAGIKINHAELSKLRNEGRISIGKLVAIANAKVLNLDPDLMVALKWKQEAPNALLALIDNPGILSAAFDDKEIKEHRVQKSTKLIAEQIEKKLNLDKQINDLKKEILDEVSGFLKNLENLQ